MTDVQVLAPPVSQHRAQVNTAFLDRNHMFLTVNSDAKVGGTSLAFHQFGQQFLGRLTFYVEKKSSLFQIDPELE